MKEIIKKILWVVLGLLFFVAGIDKLVGDPNQVRHFAEWGYPLWFLYIVGIVEVGGGISLFISQVRFYGVLLLSATMVGAAVTHLRAGETGAFPVPVVLLLLLITLAWSMRHSTPKENLGKPTT